MNKLNLPLNNNLSSQEPSKQPGLKANLISICRIVTNKMLQKGTRRNYYFDLALKGFKILLDEGPRSFWIQYKKHRTVNKIVKIKFKPLKLKPLPNYQETIDEILDNKVSIVIPTKNAGPDFDFTLDRIRTQKGIREIEIIVIDSGSTDRTLVTSEKHNAKIITIKPEEFNHGLTRNRGASEATGDFIVFLVQDAIPVGNYWLYAMLKIMNDDSQIAGVTCRQIPKSDADLYYNYALFRHSQAQYCERDRITQSDREDFRKLTFTEKRKIAGIETVCLCIKKDVFNTYMFNNLEYAEDFDLGIRLIESGYKLGFLNSVGVIHSHNRNAGYFIKRDYVNNKYLAKIFKLTPNNIEDNLDDVINEISSLYSRLMNSLNQILSENQDVIEIKSFFLRLKEGLNNNIFSIEKGDESLDRLMSEIEKLSDNKGGTNSDLNKNYGFYLDDFNDYLNNIYLKYDRHELSDTVYKLFATWAGRYLGDLYSGHSDEDIMKKIDNLLKEGI